MKATQKNRNVTLVVVGSVGLDTVETPCARREDLLGGSVSYACSAASFFCPAGMVGIVGEDFPQAYIDCYAGFGIDLAGLQRVKGKTFRWAGVYESDMINRRTLRTDLNVFADFSPDLPAAYRSAPFFLLGNISPALQLHVLAQAERPRFVAADTMDLWIGTARDPLMELIGKVNMLLLNDGEARMLTDEHNLKRCAEKILEWGPQYVVIKKGEHGAMLASRSGLFLVPAYPVDAVRDPTGAGDAFAGAFMGALASGGATGDSDVRAALMAGSVVASFNVEDFSLDRLRRMNREDVDQRLRELQRMVAMA